jgi:thioredoxin-like negative regulator of GroEL
MISLTSDIFDAFIQEHEIVLVDFWARWCNSCNICYFNLTRVKTEHANELTQVEFTEVNIETEPTLAETWEITGLPTIIIFQHGEVVYKDGFVSPDAILNELRAIL